MITKAKKSEKFENFNDFNERVRDLSDTERQKEETAKKISQTLQFFVDQQNAQATAYKDKFHDRVEEKLKHKARKKHFGSKPMKEVLGQMYKNEKIRKEVRTYEDETKNRKLERDRKNKRDIFEDLRRVFNNEITMHKGSDIDKEAGQFLLNRVNFFKDQENKPVGHTKSEVGHGEIGKKGLTFDTGGTRDGLEVIPKRGTHEGKEYRSLFNALAVIDEHNKKIGDRYVSKSKSSLKPTSSTHIIFTLLDELGIIYPQSFRNHMKRFVDFVDKADSMHYQFSGIDEKSNNRTLFDLHRNIPIKNIYDYFEDEKHTGFEVLDDKKLKELGIKDIGTIQKEKKEIKDQAMKLEAQGRFGNLDGKRFIFAKGYEFKGGQQATSYLDSGLFQIFESGDLYVYSPEGLPENIAGFKTDGNFLNIKKIKPEDLKKILDSFHFGRDAEVDLKENFVTYRRETMEKAKEKEEGEKMLAEKKANKEQKIETMQKKISDMKEIGIERLNTMRGKTIKGIINNVNGKNIYVNISPTLTGIVKLETKKHIWETGDELEVKIDAIPEKVKRAGDTEGQILTFSINQ